MLNQSNRFQIVLIRAVVLALLACANVYAQVCAVSDPNNGTSFDMSTLTVSSSSAYRVDTTLFGESVTFFVNVCDNVAVPGCSNTSAVCLVTSTGAVSVGTVRYQPDVLDQQLSLFYPAGAPVCNISGILLPTASRIDFICNTDVITGRPEFVSFDDSCTFVFRWESSQVCAEPDDTLFPEWLSILFILGLLCLAALFSGLTLGLLSLDLVQLEILIASGSESEKNYAKRIYPIRKHGNFLLCTLLLGNVMVNSAISILISDLTSGVIGLVTSTLGIVILGEIIPQSLCHKHGLAIGAYTIYLTIFFMALTSVLSYPIGKFLDWALGEELGTVFNKGGLKELVGIHGKMGEITKEETKMLQGALDLTNKTVADVMTPIDDVFMLEVDTRLTLETLQRVMDCGHSRIPVYAETRNNIQGMVLVKDLAFLNPEDEVPLRSVMEFYGRQLRRVYFDMTLDEMLHEFRTVRSHLALVWKAEESEDGGDPMPKSLGVISLEDVIEELIQMEIVDETDVFESNVNGAPTEGRRSHHFALTRLHKKGLDESAHMTMSEQQRSAVTSYLSSNVPSFEASKISTKVMRRLLDVSKVDIIDLRSKQKQSEDNATVPEHPVYVRNQPTEFFTLVLQGKIEVSSGHDGFLSEIGPFMHMGLAALTQKDYKPDFSASVKDYCQMLRISRSAYQSAVIATELERLGQSGVVSNDDVLEDEDSHESISLLPMISTKPEMLRTSSKATSLTPSTTTTTTTPKSPTKVTSKPTNQAPIALTTLRQEVEQEYLDGIAAADSRIQQVKSNKPANGTSDDQNPESQSR